MSETGRNIIHMMGEMKKLFQETALLLKTADEYMKEVGWTIRTNQCVTLSYVPDLSSRWFPQFAFRLYKSNSYKHLLPFVAIVFDDRDGDAHVEEPLLSAGWHDYGKGNELTAEDFDLDCARWHIYSPTRKDDGTFSSFDPRLEWPQYKYRIHKTTTLAIPLITVTKAEELKVRIIDPLVASIQGEDG